MQGKIEFSTIVPSFTMKIGIECLSSRDQVELCRVLVERLGIIDALSVEPDETARAQEIITEAWNKHW